MIGIVRLIFPFKESEKMGEKLPVNPRISIKTNKRPEELLAGETATPAQMFEIHLMLAILLRSQYLIVNISTISITLEACCLHWEFVNTK